MAAILSVSLLFKYLMLTATLSMTDKEVARLRKLRQRENNLQSQLSAVIWAEPKSNSAPVSLIFGDIGSQKRCEIIVNVSLKVPRSGQALAQHHKPLPDKPEVVSSSPKSPT